MRFAVALLTLCACNQVFGLDPTLPLNADAAYFDAPADAPFACPAIGVTPPFSKILHQIPQSCLKTTASLNTDRAFAECEQQQLAAGPAGGPLALVAGFELANGIHYDSPRVVPEGDQVVIRRWNISTVVGEVQLYDIGEAGQLTFVHEIKLPNNIATDSFVAFGAPSRGPKRRMFVRQNMLPLSEIELDETGASSVVASYTESDLGVTGFTGLPPSFTGDGLRIVFNAYNTQNGLFYADRLTTNDRFVAARVLMDVPNAADGFMTEQCERVYFSALGSVFWIQRN
jgi:hypothetical protein